MYRFLLFCFLLPSFLFAFPSVELGVDQFFKEGHEKTLQGKKVGLITNHTGVNKELTPTVELFLSKGRDFTLAALFSPEHGIDGSKYAFEKVEYGNGSGLVPLFSLHGKTRRPTDEMLQGLDVLIYDIQDIGVRSYTYATTLFYAMEEAAKRKIEVIVLDRPNPIGGMLVDGSMLEDKWRSFIGYVNVPYCHGMTVGELAQFFNEEYKVGCKLKVIPMKGWKRSMNFKDTGLGWIPTSPHIPESDTPLFYASTGILGELSIVNIGVGYTLPFKLVGAPWIDAKVFAEKLNDQKLPGVYFSPFHYRPFYGSYKDEECHGALIQIRNPKIYRPLAVQYMIIGLLKSLYPEKVKHALSKVEKTQGELFCKANGNEEVLKLLLHGQYIAWKMISYGQEKREEFKNLRKKYLLYE